MTGVQPPPVALPAESPPDLHPNRVYTADELRRLGRALLRSRRTEERVSEL